MDKSEITNKYELMLIVDAHLGSDEKESIFKDAAELIKTSGGNVINSQVWLEKQKFTFEIKKHKEGTYYLINFEGEGNVIRKLEEALTLKDNVLRFTVVKAEAKTASTK